MNQIALFDKVSYKSAQVVTTRYSTSFSLGIRMLDHSMRAPVYAIYGYVRFADEIVDTFHEQDKAQLLKEFSEETWKALDRGISMNPVIHAFQDTVKKYGIDRELIQAFLDSMEMDLAGQNYDHALYQKYIYGSAEVVGLMCLHVFCGGDRALYERLYHPARSLGAAFQKVNFLRDLKDDHAERGRMYFPGVDFARFTANDKKLIEQDIRRDFEDALQGIRQLPAQSRKGVYLAYRYYTKLFRKICRKQPESILQERIRINGAGKMYILAKSYARYTINFF